MSWEGRRMKNKRQRMGGAFVLFLLSSVLEMKRVREFVPRCRAEGVAT